MSDKEQDNTWRNILIFFMIWSAFIFIILPTTDEYLLNHYLKRLQCESGLLWNTTTNNAICNVITNTPQTLNNTELYR